MAFVGGVELQTVLDSVNIKSNIEDPARHGRGALGSGREGSVEESP